MKKILSLLAVAILLAVIAPQTAYAEKKKDKDKKGWKWEMPKKMTGIEEFDHYLRVCDTLNTLITTYMDSVTFYTVRQIDVQQPDGTIIKRRCVVDDKDNIRGSNEALAQYFDMTNTGLAILGDLVKITGETTAATASLAGDPLKALSYGYIQWLPTFMQTIFGIGGKFSALFDAVFLLLPLMLLGFFISQKKISLKFSLVGFIVSFSLLTVEAFTLKAFGQESVSFIFMT